VLGRQERGVCRMTCVTSQPSDVMKNTLLSSCLDEVGDRSSLRCKWSTIDYRTRLHPGEGTNFTFLPLLSSTSNTANTSPVIKENTTITARNLSGPLSLPPGRRSMRSLHHIPPSQQQRETIANHIRQCTSFVHNRRGAEFDF
jgi:hypothetical protein